VTDNTNSVWAVLSTIDCSAHVEKKGGFSYLAWTWAWAMVKENYPTATYIIDPDIVYPDGTMEVRCTVQLPEIEHTMWLPVLNFKNKAIPNPNAFDVNSSRMRCLVKCLAMFGLGHYIYAGESLPQDAVQAATEPKGDYAPAHTPEQEAEFKALVSNEDALSLLEMIKTIPEDAGISLHNSGGKDKKMKLKSAANKLEAEGFNKLDEYVALLTKAANDADPMAGMLIDELKEIGPWCKGAVWNRLDADTQHNVKTIIEAL
jgi:hypothetical protein